MVAGQSSKVIAIIQARMQSTRLPGKVLMPMPLTGDSSILEQIVNQLRNSKFQPTVIVATSINNTDNAIASLCLSKNIEVYRGDEKDVHSRFFEILHNSDYNTAIRVTGDNPIIDVEYLDTILENHVKTHSDYSYTKDLPMGMNFEVFDVKAFQRMSISQDLSVEDKEHVTLRFESDDTFTKNLIKIDCGIQQQLRLTIDYPSDYLLLSALFDLSKQYGIEPGIKLINFVLSKNPWLFQVNESNFQKKQFSSFDEEIEYATQLLNNLDLKKSAQYLSNYARV
jgi:spore coat polysaccharide biosynthesis protein SpsF